MRVSKKRLYNKHSYTVEYGTRLRVGVRAKKRQRVGVCVSALLRCSWHRANPHLPFISIPPLPPCSFGISFGYRLPVFSSLVGPESSQQQPNESQMMRQTMFPGKRYGGDVRVGGVHEVVSVPWGIYLNCDWTDTHYITSRYFSELITR